MRQFDPQKPLIFIHVPKTAGISVRNVVQSWFPYRLHHHYHNEVTGTMPPPVSLDPEDYGEKPPVIYGHFNSRRGFGVEDYYPGVTQFLTILRDPFETAVSNYFYLRKVSGAWKNQSRTPSGDLETYIQGTRPNILNHFPREVTMENFKDILEEYFIEIGITEQLPKSLKRMADKLGKSFDPDMLETMNVTARDQVLDETYRTQFRERHVLEYAVYNYVKARIEAADPEERQGGSTL